MLQRLLREGGEWVGRRRALTLHEFRRSFGVYPQTVAHIAEMGVGVSVGVGLVTQSTLVAQAISH